MSERDPLRTRLLAGMTRVCDKHGQYIASGADCPVCEGRSTGRTWSNTTWTPPHYANEVERQLRQRPKGKPLLPDDMPDDDDGRPIGV